MISRIIKWFALFVLMYLLQTTVVAQIAVGGVKPDLLLLAVFFCGIRTEIIPAVFAGFFIGLAQDFYSPEILGQNALAKTIAGFFAGLFNEKVMRIDPIFQILLVALVFLIHDAVFFTVQVMKAGSSFQLVGIALITTSLPRILYSFLFALIPILRELLFPPALRR